MRKALSLFLLILSISVWGYQDRNYLQKQVIINNLEDVLVLNQKWVQYPPYADRSEWNKLMGKNKDIFISEGEKYLDYQWQVVKATDYLEYSKTGNRTGMETVYNANLNAISTLFIAELAEGKGRFIDQIINGVFYTCEMTSWSISAHLSLQRVRGSFPDYTDQVIELVSGDVGAMFSWIYYFLNKEFDQINPLISKRISHEIDTRILTPYLNEDRFWWMAVNVDANNGFVNNWNPWCNSNVLQCFLLMENDPDRLAKGVYKTMVSVDKFINYTNEDGACEEGPSYWGHAAGKLYDYLQLLYDGTGGKVSLFAEPMIKNMGEYISRSYVGDGWVVNFADASAKEKLNPYLIYRFGNMLNSSEMKQFASYLNTNFPQKISPARDLYRTLESIYLESDISKYKSIHTNPSFTWYPETEFCYIKQGQLFLAVKGGYNDESHNHNDIGTFSLYVDNEPVFIDAGVGTYSKKTFSDERYTIWTMQSDYHNLPRINGYSQSYGKQYRSKNARVDKKKNTISLDISNAYPVDAGINEWIRTYRIKDNDLYVEDHFDITDPKKENQLNFMVWGDIDTSKSGLIVIKTPNGEIVQFLYNKESFDPVVESVVLDDARLSKVWGSEIKRLSLNAKRIQKEGKYNFIIKAQKKK